MRNEDRVMNQQKNIFLELLNQYIKMNYYQYNRQEILRKAKENYSKKKAAEYYKQNKEAIKGNSKERYKNTSQEEKDKIKEYQKNKKYIKNWFSIKKKH